MKKSNTQASWDDVVEDLDDEPPTPVKPVTPATPMPSTFSGGIRPSSLGAFPGSSLGTSKLGGSSWGAAGLSKVGDTKVVPSTNASKITSIPGMNTPQKYSFGPSGFSAHAAKPSLTFGSKIESTPAAQDKKASDPADAGRTPSPLKKDDNDGTNFASLLATPHKNAFANLRVQPTPGKLASASPAPREHDKNPILEHEKKIFEKRGKLHAYIDQTWRERGRGLMTVVVDKECSHQGRAVMSADGTRRLLINVGVSKTLKPKVTQSKSVSFLAFLPTTTPEEAKTLTSFMITFQDAAWAEEFVRVIENIKAQHPDSRPESPS
ncbi:hypothetical protein HDU86_004291 [Geranomyces michiganensis]|nr:hypothetical protein HDU86_004291 [Geranomyces michiganensis]